MGSEQVEAAQGGMPPRSGDEPFVDNGPNEAAVACDESCTRRGSIGVRVTRCDSPASASACITAASALTAESDAAMPFRMAEECAQVFLTDFAWRSM